MPRVLEAITPLGPKALLFHEMAGEESLSTLFEFTVTLVSEQLSIAPKALLGKDMTVSIQTENDGPKRYLSGITTRFAMVGRHKQYHIYQATLKPWLWLASRRSDSKIFQQMKVPDIIEAVLKKYGFPVKRALSGSYRLWDYCVQYHETDYNFVARLMEHEGIYYYFEHKAGKHILVLCDGLSSHKPLSPRSNVNYYGIDAGTDEREEHFHTWRPREEIDPGEYISDDYDFTRPKAELETKNKAPKGHANDAWERYSWPGGYLEVGEGETYAKARRESLQSEQTRATGEGNLRALAPGYLMTLARCPRAEQNTEHLIVGVTYELKGNAHGMAEVATRGVECVFTTLTQPSALPYRPQRLTPKPRSQGPQVAVVVGPPGEEIYTDKYGRVKVQFPWDRYGENNEKSSCWMRVSHPWAGSNYGAIHIPRIGQEVIVDHVDGDPDYPIITGRVYNADQMPPWELPKHKTQSGTQTRWSKGGGGRSMLRFEDKKGIEHLELSTTYGQTHLHMGYLMNQGSEAKRSYGFELRTNEWGSIRADKGLLLTTYTQDFTQKIAHDSPDGFAGLGAGLDHTSTMMKDAEAAISGAKSLISALRNGRAQQLTSLIPSAVSALGGGGGAPAAISAIFGAAGNPSSSAGELSTSDSADPAMSESREILQKSQKIDKPIVSIVSPEGQSLISPKPIVVSSGQSVSVHAKGNITFASGAQLTQLVQSSMYTHVKSGGQNTVVSAGDTTHTTASGALNMVSKANASMTSTTGDAHIEGNKNVLIKADSEGVLITAPKKIKLQCGSTMIEMDGVGGTITITAANLIATGSKATKIFTDEEFLAKGKKGDLQFTADLDQKGANIKLNC